MWPIHKGFLLCFRSVCVYAISWRIFWENVSTRRWESWISFLQQTDGGLCRSPRARRRLPARTLTPSFPSILIHLCCLFMFNQCFTVALWTAFDAWCFTRKFKLDINTITQCQRHIWCPETDGHVSEIDLLCAALTAVYHGKS